jgi:hypothetical protein
MAWFSREELRAGTILKCSWNGMSDFYEVIGLSKKTIYLQEIEWETCPAPEGEEPSDPVHRWCRIKRDDMGEPIYVKDFNGRIPKATQKRLTEREDGKVKFKSPNYSGAGWISISKSDYTEMYWG